MAIQQIFEKLGNQQKLSPGEMNELILWSKNMEGVRAQNAGLFQGSNRVISRDRVPSVMGSVTIDCSQQTISNSTNTFVSFDVDYGIRSGVVSWDSSDPTKFKCRTTGMIGIIGKIEWEQNTTGHRVLTVRAFNSSNVQLYSAFMNTFTGSAALVNTNDSYPFAMAFPLSLGSGAASHLKFKVFQDSGGDLGINYMSVCLFSLE